MNLKITEPVENGIQYWVLYDADRNLDLCSIHASVPEAAYLIRIVQSSVVIHTPGGRRKLKAVPK